MSNKNLEYIFWTDDFSILYKDNNYLNFMPSHDMTRIEQLNAITRFCIYFIILLYLTGNTSGWIQLPITLIVVTIIFKFIFDNDKNGKFKEFEKMTNIREKIEHFDNNGMSNNNIINDNNVKIESGYYDSDNNLIIGEYTDKQHKKKKDKKYSYDQIMEYNKAVERKPTHDNPFMNPNINDTLLLDPPKASNIDDDEIQNQITNSFNSDIFRDVGDLFDVKNSERQFYTLPQTFPNGDTIGLANWLYKDARSCKSNQSDCFIYEDLKQKFNTY
jgi:hypothetical protein